MDDWSDVADAEGLSPGACRTVEVRGRRLALVRLGDAFHALDDACPHRGGALGAGFVDGTKVHCPLHGWGFDVRTGECLVRPEKPVRTHPVRVAGGRVWVHLPEGT
jgi:NAD(P)H-dependent nitrite reductase small subunit